MLEAARHTPGLRHLVYASSSSVYGERPIGEGNSGAFSETDIADSPRSLYAATKRANELMSASYASLYGLPQSGLRFFTVYGPWGRPDMAYFSFTQKILAGEPIEVFGEGRMARDLTYIDGLLEKALGTPAVKIMRPMQAGDVTATYADVSRIATLTGYAPKIGLAEGLARFAAWYRGFYG